MASSPDATTRISSSGNFDADRHDPRSVHGRSPLSQPRDAGSLRPGLDVQGRDRGGRARDAAAYTPDSTFVDPGYCDEYGKRVNNYDTDEPDFGRVTLVAGARSTPSTRSSATSARSSGAKAILDYAKRFGFYERRRSRRRPTSARPSGLYKRPASSSTRRNDCQVDPGRLAFGQERMLVTPMQMAMVAAAIANGGVVMRPYVVERIVAPDGAIVRGRSRTSSAARSARRPPPS